MISFCNSYYGIIRSTNERSVNGFVKLRIYHHLFEEVHYWTASVYRKTTLIAFSIYLLSAILTTSHYLRIHIRCSKKKYKEALYFLSRIKNYEKNMQSDFRKCYVTPKMTENENPQSVCMFVGT